MRMVTLKDPQTSKTERKIILPSLETMNLLKSLGMSDLLKFTEGADVATEEKMRSMVPMIYDYESGIWERAVEITIP